MNVKFAKDTGYIINEMKKTEMCNCLKQKLFNISYNFHLYQRF